MPAATPKADTALERRIEYVPLQDVTPATRNAKAHDDAGVRRSIQRFGFTAPLLVDERTGQLVAGHGRLEALRTLHDEGKNVPNGVVVDYAGDWTVPVVRGWASRDDAHADAYAIADNKLTEAGGWDERLLAELLEDLLDESPDLLTVTGFTQTDLDHLIADATTGGGGGGGGLGDSDPDDLPDDLPDTPVTKAGDVWTLGAHRLVVGDATDPAVVRQLMAGKKAICMWTYIDDADAAPAVLAAAAEHALREGAPAYLAHPPQTSIGIGQAVLAAGWSLRQQLLWVWDEPTPVDGDYQQRHEPIWYGFTPSKGGTGRLGRGGDRWYGDDAQSTVFEVPRPTRANLHPNAQPVTLVKGMLTNSVPRAGLVYDPHAGVGATLIACQSLELACRAAEPDPRYADVLIRRWARLTGLTATREGDGLQVGPDDAEEAA